MGRWELCGVECGAVDKQGLLQPAQRGALPSPRQLELVGSLSGPTVALGQSQQ